jgi:hypothetical protein
LSTSRYSYWIPKVDFDVVESLEMSNLDFCQHSVYPVGMDNVSLY